MRPTTITITLDPEVYEAAQRLAAQQKIDVADLLAQGATGYVRLLADLTQTGKERRANERLVDPQRR